MGVSSDLNSPPSFISRVGRVRKIITLSHNVSLNVLCFPFTIGKVKITVFHLLVACTFVFTYLWGYVIYSMLIKDNQEETKLVGVKRESLIPQLDSPSAN